MFFTHTATDERENINAVMQHIGMETCIRFKDMSEEDDAEQNQEYDDEELGPVYAENNNTDNVITAPVSVAVVNNNNNNNNNKQLIKSGENELDMNFVDRLFEKSTIANDEMLKDQPLRKRTSATKDSSTTKDSSISKGDSTTQTHVHRSKTTSSVQSATTSSEHPKVAKQVPEENSSNITKVHKKSTSELKRKKHMKPRHNDKQGLNSTSRANKRTDKKAAAQKPGKKFSIFYYNKQSNWFNV